MDKRYQVFLSSTYADLKDERQKVLQTLMEMDCIPAGMELFPASDEEQFEFIKKVIDDCDYYILIIGGRYGSTTEEGISYTEKEYDYAVGKGLRVIALIHDDVENIPVGKTDKDPVLTKKLNDFRDRAKQNRLVKFWRNAGELPGLVALSLSKTIKTYPAVGWVRASAAGTSELLTEINELRKENGDLKVQLQVTSQSIPVVQNLADMDEKFQVSGKWEKPGEYLSRNFIGDLTWRELFGFIAPKLYEHIHDDAARRLLAEGVVGRIQPAASKDKSDLDEHVFQTIKIQFLAHKFIEVKELQTQGGGTAIFWKLTTHGVDAVLAVLSIKSAR
jgi:hypothetical protein